MIEEGRSKRGAGGNVRRRRPRGFNSRRDFLVLACAGLACGLLSGLFGASDLMARGTSLLVMFPGAISGSIANWKRGIVHLKSGVIIGVCAMVTAPLGTLIAGLISPRVGSLLFAAWLALLAVRGAWTAIKVTSAVHHS